jgi:hypothetical protein
MDDGQALVRLVGRRRRGGRCGGAALGTRFAEERRGAALAGNVVDGGRVDG